MHAEDAIPLSILKSVQLHKKPNCIFARERKNEKWNVLSVAIYKCLAKKKPSLNTSQVFPKINKEASHSKHYDASYYTESLTTRKTKPKIKVPFVCNYDKNKCRNSNQFHTTTNILKARLSKNGEIKKSLEIISVTPFAKSIHSKRKPVNSSSCSCCVSRIKRNVKTTTRLSKPPLQSTVYFFENADLSPWDDR